MLTIELQAFDPEYGQRVVGMMLKESERFINKLGHQVALDSWPLSRKRSIGAYRRLQDEGQGAGVSKQPSTYQSGIPSSARLGVVSQIEAELVNQQAQLKQLRSYEERTPPVSSRAESVDALTRQLEQERAKLTGLDKDAANERSTPVTWMCKPRPLWQQIYKTGPHQSGAGQGRGIPQAQTPAGYPSQPSLAQDAEYPRRLYNLATVVCCFFPLLRADRDGPSRPCVSTRIDNGAEWTIPASSSLWVWRISCFACIPDQGKIGERF